MLCQPTHLLSHWVLLREVLGQINAVHEPQGSLPQDRHLDQVFSQFTRYSPKKCIGVTSLWPHVVAAYGFSELVLSPGQHHSAPYCFPQMLMRYLCFLELLWWRKDKQWMRLLCISFFTIKYHKWDSLYLWFQPRRLKHIMDNSFFVKLKVQQLEGLTWRCCYCSCGLHGLSATIQNVGKGGFFSLNLIIGNIYTVFKPTQLQK